MRSGGRGSLFPLALLVCAFAALIAAGGAGAATITNGGFETGNFQGWHVQQATEAGDWFVYAGTTTPLGSKRSPVTKVPKPPLGQFAAIADEAGRESLILWQDIALEPGLPHSLSLDAFYGTDAPLATPQTLSVDQEVLGEAANQQFRIDLVAPGAPIDSVAPPEVLATLFQTKTAGPSEMKPTPITADLTPFGGQTVRLRIAVAATGKPGVPEPGRPVAGILNAGVDAVSVDGSNPNQGGTGAAKLRLGRSAKNRQKGTVTLSVRVPAAGTLTASSPGKAKPKKIVAASARPKAARTVRLTIKPTPASRRVLQAKHRLRVPIAIRFVSQTGAVETANRPVVLELRARHHRR